MTTEQWFEKAAAYFGGAMTAEEIQDFERETNADKELSQLMQLWKRTDTEAMLYEKYKEEAGAFIATHNRLKPNFVKKEQDAVTGTLHKKPSALKNLRFSIWQWAAVAAVILGIIFLADLFLAPKNNAPVAQQKTTTDTSRLAGANDSIANLAQQNANKSSGSSISSETLYAQAFTKDEVPKNFSGPPLDNAFFYYNSGQYKEAIESIDNINQSVVTRGNNASAELTNFYASYYKALSLMELDSTAAAIEPLQKCLQQNVDEALKAKAQWYLALAYLQQQNYSSAENTLGQLISNPGAGSYKDKAEKLLAALKK
jgi:tetratricopeptide (TPR) repeat protein